MIIKMFVIVSPKNKLLFCVLLGDEAFPQGPQNTFLAPGTLSFLSPLSQGQQCETQPPLPPAQSSHHGSGVSRKLYLWVTGGDRLIAIYADIWTGAADCRRRQASWLVGRAVFVWVICAIKLWGAGEQKPPDDLHAVSWSVSQWPVILG